MTFEQTEQPGFSALNREQKKLPPATRWEFFINGEPYSFLVRLDELSPFSQPVRVWDPDRPPTLNVEGHTQLLMKQADYVKKYLEDIEPEKGKVTIVQMISNFGTKDGDGKTAEEFITASADQEYAVRIVPNIENPLQTKLLFLKGTAQLSLDEVDDNFKAPFTLSTSQFEPHSKYFMQNLRTTMFAVPAGMLEQPETDSKYDIVTIEEFFNKIESSQPPIEAVTIAAVYKLLIELEKSNIYAYKSKIKSYIYDNLNPSLRVNLENNFDFLTNKPFSEIPPGLEDNLEDYIKRCISDEVEKHIPNNTVTSLPSNKDVGVPDTYFGILKKTKWFDIKDNGEQQVVVVDSNEVLICPVTIRDGEVYMTLNIEVAPALQNRYTLLLPGGGMKATESATEAGIRELQEEGGKTGKMVDALGQIKGTHLVSGVSNIVVALDTVDLDDEAKADAKKRADEQHEVQSLELPLFAIEELILSGFITDARTIAGIGMAKHHLAEKNLLPDKYLHNFDKDCSVVNEHLRSMMVTDEEQPIEVVPKPKVPSLSSKPTPPPYPHSELPRN